MKSLNGREIAGYVKERQARHVRSLRQARNIQPKLAIVQVVDNPVINTYVSLKKQYAAEIGVEVELHKPSIDGLASLIDTLNEDESVHGIIIQLPLPESADTQALLSLVSAEKDVDGLAEDTNFTPATPLAITWLLDGYNVQLSGKNVVVVGQGRLVGKPLTQLLVDRRLSVRAVDESVDNLESAVREADILISATGQPGLITTAMVKQGAVAVDAGVATADMKTVGDFSDEVYLRDDLTMTPPKGGVGPLTVCALFENVLRAASI